jgi:signal transduction histidine kinase
VARVKKLRARPRGLDPTTIDLIAAVALVAASVVLFAGARHAFPAVVFGVVGPASVASRRRAPVASTALIAVAAALVGLTDHGVHDTPQGIAACLCFYTLGRRTRGRVDLRIDVALLALAAIAVAFSPQPSALDSGIAWLLYVALPYVTGRTVESRRSLTRELEANAARARREQEARARSAAAEERTRIARELHDVIAHSLSVMVIQTVAAREVASTDRASARAALAAVQLAGREALLEMRRMIGVLRRGDVQLAGSATPGLDQLDLLAQRARMSGLPVELSVRGRRRALPEALDLVAFRIVQEALTNSIKHAGPARASVTVTFEADRVELEIYDDGRGASPDRPTGEGAGHGLVGMRERLALFDGELSTGGRPGGGFRVFARLPVEETLAA